MAHYAQVINNIVHSVIVAEQDFIDTLPNPEQWIQTSYNTRGGVHYNSETNEPSEDQSKALRYNYAGIGFIYDSTHDAFYAPEPEPINGETYILNLNTFTWEVNQ